MDLEDLTGSPNPLAAHYSRFQVADRLLLTGHSHQAWPDVGFEGQQRAWLDAAELVDAKWDRAFAVAARVRQGWADWLDDDARRITLGANTHELVVRLLSALPLRARPRIVTTDGEFHTLRRQLDRLAEEGIELVRVAADPASTLPERLAEALDDRTALVAVSSVFYGSARIVRGLGHLQEAADRLGTALLVDAYHAINVLPYSVREEGVGNAFVVGGGYKYCQLGEGNCFLRTPPDCDLRPIVTGWFAEFEALSGPASERVAYAEGPDRFAGATYDPTAHYRAAAVLDFFEEHSLTPHLLRQVSQHQIGELVRLFDALDLDSTVVDRDRSAALSDTGGFLCLHSAHAATLSAGLRERGVATDYRGEILRLGPAPYLDSDQLEAAMVALGGIAREIGK